ncbi:hypothetical protein BV22DRAFT_1135792 [Leucogyrophana mollusca]|uniref:Uncharacterized protein n=1 Tax=Leucogyrophana mollusca TaxID=85980 RepID=A0ACB8AVE8_9AGAM|nr:hypothetical protein BV22DRAFT_1135792 [Leucogyrophana mollusca]
MNHGIVFFDVPSLRVTRFLSIRTLVGSTSLSPDHRFLAVSNLSTGFDIYDLHTGAPVLNLSHDASLALQVPVRFIHRGFAVLGGSTTGDVRIWDAGTGQHLHVLHHPKNDVILATAAYYSRSEDKFLIATGTCTLRGGRPYIELWQAADVYNKDGYFRHRSVLKPVVQPEYRIYHFGYVLLVLLGIGLAYFVGLRNGGGEV